MIGGFADVADIVGSIYSAKDHDSYHDLFVKRVGNQSTVDRPHAYMYSPVFETLNDNTSDVGGSLIAVLPFDVFMVDLLPDGVSGFYCVVRNSCGQE